jgi:Ca-activated chloride channel family protein
LLRHPDDSPVIQVHHYPVDKDVLRKIAETTGAQFFEAGDEIALREIYDEIDRLEKSDVEYDVNALYDELFHWPLASGLFLLLAEIVLSRTLFLRIP